MSYSTTLEDYRNKVKGNLSLDLVPDNLEWSDSFIDGKIHEARQKFWNKAEYHNKSSWTAIPSVINQEEYDIPTTVDNIKFVRFFDGTSRQNCRPLTQLKYLLFSRTPQYGFPFFFLPIGRKLRLYPIPSVAVANGIEIFGDFGITKLVDDDDIDEDIEDRFNYLVEKYATALCWTKAEQFSQANSWFNQFEADWQDCAYDIKSVQTDQSTDIGLEGGYLDELNQRRYGHLT